VLCKHGTIPRRIFIHNPREQAKLHEDANTLHGILSFLDMAFFMKVSMYLIIPYHVVDFLFSTRGYEQIAQNYTTQYGVP
jgi:hypothetical protein